jgi:RNA polymerase sigma factor (TIGR02999 family)
MTPEDLEASYATLRAVARRLLAGHRGSLDATALVHEAWIKLSEAGAHFESRTHFVAVSVRTLRQVLVDAARAKNANKRGGARERITLSGLEATPNAPWELVDVDRVLSRLLALDERRGRIAELRIFGGLEQEEIADALDVSRSTVAREWRQARAWLLAQLEPT